MRKFILSAVALLLATGSVLAQPVTTEPNITNILAPGTAGQFINTTGGTILGGCTICVLGVQQTSQGGLTLANTAAGAFATTIKSSNSASAAANYILPIAPPGGNGYALTSTTAGVWSWTNPSSFGGPCTTTANSIQYDNAGAFGCISTSTWNGTNLILGGLNVTSTGGGTVTLNGGNDSSSGLGGNVNLNGGSSGSSTGGSVNLTGGTSTSGVGGEVTLTGGGTTAGTTCRTGQYSLGGNGTGQTGGAVNISGGADSTGTSGGGEVRIFGGVDQGPASGAEIDVGPDANTAGGVINITGGTGGGLGGTISITSGDSTGANGGAVNVVAGVSDTNTGGQISLISGNSATGTGGLISLQAGNATAGTAAGGNVDVTPGTSFGGTAGVTHLNGTTQLTGQLVPTFGTPTIASGACGSTTNGTLAAGSVNQSGEVIIASATTTSCTISFSTTLAAAPKACVLEPGNAQAATELANSYVSAITTGHWVITGTALASTDYYYHCI